MRAADKSGAEAEGGVVRYAMGGVRSAGQTQVGRSLERDLLIRCGLRGGMDQASIARAIGVTKQAVNQRVRDMGLDRA